MAQLGCEGATDREEEVHEHRVADTVKEVAQTPPEAAGARRGSLAPSELTVNSVNGILEQALLTLTGNLDLDRRGSVAASERTANSDGTGTAAATRDQALTLTFAGAGPPDPASERTGNFGGSGGGGGLGGGGGGGRAWEEQEEEGRGGWPLPGGGARGSGSSQPPWEEDRAAAFTLGGPPQQSQQQQQPRRPEPGGAPPPLRQSREQLKLAVFRFFDADGDGRLCQSELRRFAEQIGFDGSEADWAEEFVSLCEVAGADPARGIDYVAFSTMADDDSDQPVLDEELAAMLDGATAGSTRRRGAAEAAAPPPPPPAVRPPGGEASAPAAGPPAPQTREALKRAVFRLFDADGDGRLGCAELRAFGGHMGFDGTDEEWAEEYAALCEGFGVSPRDGIDFETFSLMVDDDSEQPLADAELAAMFRDLSAQQLLRASGGLEASLPRRRTERRGAALMLPGSQESSPMNYSFGPNTPTSPLGSAPAHAGFVHAAAGGGRR